LMKTLTAIAGHPGRHKSYRRTAQSTMSQFTQSY
jgi:hypothetical protein